MEIRCRGVRGAITAERNDADSILLATRELLERIVARNEIRTDSIVSVIFSTTADLNAAFPAVAARRLGWDEVPLLCTHGMDVPGALDRCIRVLLHWNTERAAVDVHPVYLRGAAALRPDLAGAEQAHEPPHDIIAILGLGLMGGSLAAALRRAGHARRVIGYDVNADTAARALRLGLVNETAPTIAGACSTASLIVLAAPVGQLDALVRSAAEAAPSGALLIDLGSVKSRVVAAMNALPSRVRAVAGHPMCGRDASGPASAEPSLFRGAPFVLCRTTRTNDAAVRVAEAMVAAAGARTVWLSADEHDDLVARVSHLPYVLAVALVETVRGSGEAASRLAASGFRDASRLAASEPRVMGDILLGNAHHVRSAVTRAKEQNGRAADGRRAGGRCVVAISARRGGGVAPDMGGAGRRLSRLPSLRR